MVTAKPLHQVNALPSNKPTAYFALLLDERTPIMSKYCFVRKIQFYNLCPEPSNFGGYVTLILPPNMFGGVTATGLTATGVGVGAAWSFISWSYRNLIYSYIAAISFSAVDVTFAVLAFAFSASLKREAISRNASNGLGLAAFYYNL